MAKPGPDGNTNPEPKKQYIDPVALELNGITEYEANQSGYSVIPMTLEQSYNVNKPSVGGMDLLSYQKLYRNVMENDMYNNVYQKRNDEYRDVSWDFLQKIQRPAHTKPGLPVQAHPKLWGISPENAWQYSAEDSKLTPSQTGFEYSTRGKRQQTMTDEEIMESRKQYWNPKKNITGGWESLDNYVEANTFGSPFRIDQNGNKKMLVKDNANKMYVEVDSDEVYAGNQLRSMYNIQTKDSGFIQHVADSFWNGITDLDSTMWGNLAETMGTIGNLFSGSDEVNSWQKWGREVQNYGNARKSKISEAAEAEGMFGSWRAGFGTVSNMLPQLGAQAAIGYMTGGASVYAQAAAAGAKTTLGYVGATATSRLLKGAPYMFGAIYAANGMNEEGKAAGLSDNDRMVMNLLAGGAVFAAEKFTSKFLGATGIADGFANSASRDIVNKNLLKGFQEVTKRFTPTILSKTAATAEREAAKRAATSTIGRYYLNGLRATVAAGAFGKKAGKNLLSGLQYGLSLPIRWGYSTAPKSLKGRALGAVASAYEEGVEEEVEKHMNYWFKEAYNAGMIGIDRPDRFATPGNGLFDNTVHTKRFDEFIAGAIGGGIMGAIFGGRMKRNFSKYNAIELALQYEGDAEKADAAVINLKESIGIDDKLTDVNDNYLAMFPESEREAIKSRNDVAFEALREDVRRACEIIKTFNLTDAEKIQRIAGGDMKLVRDTVDNLVNARTLSTEIETLKNQLQNTDPADINYKEIERQISEKQENLQQVNKLADDVLSGKAIENYRAQTLIRGLLIDNEFQQAYSQVEAITDPQEKAKKLQSIFDTSIANAEKRDLWSDQEAALNVIYNSREMLEQFKQSRAVIEERTKQSNDLVTDFDSIDFTDMDSIIKVLQKVNQNHLQEIVGQKINDVTKKINDEQEEIQAELDNDFNSVRQKFDFDESYTFDMLYNGTQNDEVDAEIANVLNNKKDKTDRFRELSRTKNEIDKANSLLANKAPVKYVPGAGIDSSTNQWNNRDHFSQNPNEKKYKKITGDSEVEISESAFTAMQEAANMQGQNSFEYNGEMYVAEDTDQIKVDGKKLVGSTLVDDPQSFEYLEIDDVNELFLQMPTPSGMNVRDELNQIMSEFEQTKILTAQMKERLKEINKQITNNEQMLAVFKWANMLAKNNILSEQQQEYLGLKTYNEINQTAFTTKLATDRSMFINTAMSTLSKDERDNKLNELKDSIVKMQAQVYNELVSHLQVDGDIEVDGKKLEFPGLVPLDASEAEVMQAYQFMHYFVKNLDAENKAIFKAAFDDFWATKIESKSTIKGAEYQGMFLDGFDIMLDFDAFQKGYNGPQYNGDLNNSFRELFYYHAINMMMNVDPAVAFTAIGNVIDAVDVSTKFDLDKTKYPSGDHTAEQIFNVLIGITHLSENITRNSADADQSFIDLLDHVKDTMKLGTQRLGLRGKGLYSVVTDSAGKYSTSGKHIKDNVMSFFGYGGVGKSTFIIKTLSEIALNMGKKNFVFIAPNLHQKEILEKSVKDVFPKTINVEFFVVSDFVKKQDEYKDAVIFADEISLYKDEEKNSVAFNFTKVEGKDISTSKKADGTNVGFIHESNTVFLLGDTLQAPPSGKEYDESPKIQKYTQHGFNITSVKRSSLIEIYKIQTEFRRNAKNNELGPPQLFGYSYTEDNNVKRGVKLNNNKDTFLSEAKTAVQNGNGFIIVYSEKEYNEIISDIDPDKHENVFVMTDLAKSPQGRTLDGEVYVFMPFSETKIESDYNSKKLYNMYMLTAVSRASRFVSVYTGDGLGNKNSIVVSEDQIESFDDSIEAKKTRKAQLWNRISSVPKGLTAIKATPVPVKSKVVPEITETEKTETQEETEVKTETVKDTSKGTGVKSNSKSGKRASQLTLGRKKRKIKSRNWRPKNKQDDSEFVEVPEVEEVKEPATAYEQQASNQADMTADEIENITDKEDAGVEHAAVESTIDNGEFGLSVKTEGNANIVTVFVDGNPFVIAVGGIYNYPDPSDDTKTKQLKVSGIRINDDGEYIIITERLKPFTVEEFSKFALNPVMDPINEYETALVSLTQTGILTLFGKTMSEMPTRVTNEEANKQAYAQRAIEIAKLYKNLGNSFDVKIEILKDARTIDWNGKLNRPFAYVLQVSINNGEGYQYFTSHYIENPNRAGKTQPKDATAENLESYNNILYDMVNKLYENGRREFEHTTNKKSISASSFVGFSDKLPVMSYNETKAMLDQYGIKLSETYQGLSKNGKTETYAIAYFDNPKNGQKIIFESIPANKMNESQKDFMLNEVQRQIGILENAILKNNAEIYINALSETDGIFAYNYNNIALFSGSIASNVYTPKDTENKTTPEYRTLARLEVLRDLVRYLSPIKVEGARLNNENIVSNFRLQTQIQSDKRVTGVEYMSTVKGVYFRMPVMDISANILLEDTAGLAKKVENQKEFENYQSAFSEIQSELNDILGEGIQLGIIKSNLYHGFVDKLGKIHMNMHNGVFDMSTLHHEIAHYVDEFLLTDEVKEPLYSEVDRKYGITEKYGDWRKDLDVRRKIAEILADGGERYKSDRRNLKGISKLMRTFFDWFNRFMSRIGIVNNKINDFYYDLYVAKKYKTAQGMKLNTVRDEMPFDSLYSRIIYPDSSFNTIAANMFYDRASAFDVANNVAKIVANEVIMPSMNRRMFLDGTVSFADIINRIENKSREKVMFVTDEKGNFIYEEQVVDGTKMRLPIVRDLMIDFTHPFLRWRYNAKNENGETVYGLSLQYYDKNIKGYAFARPNSQGIFFSDKKEREAFRRELLKAVNDYRIETIDGLVNVTDTTTTGKEKLKKIGNKDKVLYQNAMLLNDKVFKAMVNRIFPTLDIETILNRDGKIRYDDILESTNRIKDANIRKDEEERNQMDNQSDIMRLIINNIPRYSFTNDGTIVVDGDKKLNDIIANKILTEVHSNLWVGNREDGIDAFQKSMAKYINSVLSETDPGRLFELNANEKFINAYSIYKTFFDPQVKTARDKGMYYPSHTRIYNWNKFLAKETRGTLAYEQKLDTYYNEYLAAVNTEKQENELIKRQVPLTRDEFELNLANRSKMSETILNSIITHFGSLTTNKYENVVKYGNGKRSNFLSMSKQTSSTHDTKIKLEQKIISDLQISGGVMPQRFVDLFINRKDPVKVQEGKEKKDSKFLMTDRGIRFKQTTKIEDSGIIIIPLENGKFRNLTPQEMQNLAEYAKRNGINVETIVRKIFTDFFNSGRNNGQVRQAVRALSSRRTGADEYGLDNLSDLLAPLMAATYTYTIQKGVDPSNVESTQPVYKLYVQALENTAKSKGQKSNYGKISDATLESMQDVEAGSNILNDGEEYFFPTGFYKEMEALASLMAFYENNPTVRSLDNRRKLYIIGNQHNFNYKYSNGTNSNLVDKFEEVVKGPHTNPNSRGSYVLNPILERTSTNLPVIRSTPYMMGIDSKGKTVELKNMTVQDNLHAAIANFTKGENAKSVTYNISPVLIPVDNTGNRGRQHLFEAYFGHYNGGGNGFLTKIDNVTPEGIVESFKLDSRNIMSMIKRAFAIKEEAQVHSLNRWINFLSNPTNGKVTNNAHNMLISLGITPIDTTLPGWKQQRDRTIKELTNYIINNDFYIIDDEVIGFEGSKLRLGSDYLIVKKNKNDIGGRLYLGHDASMMNAVITRNEDGTSNYRSVAQQLFNYSNYNEDVNIEIGNEKSITVKLHEILRTDDFTNDQLYVDYINNLGVTSRYVLTENNLSAIIDGLFKRHYEETNQIAEDDGYKMTSNNIFDLYAYEDSVKEVEGINIYGTTPSVIWKGLIIGHAMVNFFSSHAIEGTEAIHLSNTIYENETGPVSYGVNRNKRALSHTSTGFVPSIKTHNGIDPTSKIMVIKDLKVNASISTPNGVINKEHIIADGQSINSPFHMEMYFNSIGGNNGSLNRRIQKSIAQQYNYQDGSTFLKKHAGFIISKTMMDSSVDMANLFEYMMNPALRPVLSGEQLNQMSFLKKSDIDNLPGDNLYQRYLIYYDQTATESALKQTLDNASNLGGIKTLIESNPKYKNKTTEIETILKNWKDSQFNDTVVGQYNFVANLLTDLGMSNLIAQEGEKNHNRAIEMVVEHYVNYRAKNPETYQQKYPYLSSIQFTGNKKDQTKEFEMPFVAVNKSAGATHADAQGNYVQGRPMPMFVKDGDAAPTNFYELVDYWKNQEEDAPFDKWTYDFDNTQEITQLNPERDIDDNVESPMVQAMSIILANPNSLNSGLAKEISTDLSSLMRVGLENVMRFITNDGNWSEEADQKVEKLKIDAYKLSQESGTSLSASEIRTIENFVKAKIKKSMSSSDDSTMLSEIIGDDEISLNVSHGAVTRAQQYIAAYLRKEAVKRKVDAMRLVQTAGNFIDMVEHKQTGEVFMLSEAYKHAAKMGVSFDSIFDIANIRGLKHTTLSERQERTIDQDAKIKAIEQAMNEAIAMNPENKKEITKAFTKIKMKYLIDENLVDVAKGEAIVPAVMFKKFNIPSNVGLNEIFRLYGKKDGVVTEMNLMQASLDYNTTKQLIQTFVDDNIGYDVTFNQNGKPKVNVTYNQGQKGLNSYFEIMFIESLNQYLKDNYRKTGQIYAKIDKEMEIKHGDAYKAMKEGSLEKSVEDIKAEMSQRLQEESVNFAKDEIVRLVNQYTDAITSIAITLNDNIGMRTPSGPGSGFINNIVGFVNDASSVGFVNTIKNLIDGSDQDVDQFTIYYMTANKLDTGEFTQQQYNDWKDKMKKDGNYDALSEEEAKVINNKLIRHLQRYFTDPKNASINMAAIDLDPVKKAADGTYKELFRRGDVAHNIGHSFVYRNIAMDGQAVGPFANNQKLQTLLYSGYRLNSRRGINSDIYNFKINSVENAFGQVMEEYDSVPVYMEMLINAATDNPKLLILGAMNITMNNSDMASAMMFAPKEIQDYMRSIPGNENMSEVDAVLNFLKGEANKDIFSNVKKNSGMYNGGYSKSYYNTAYNYFKNLQAYKSKYKEQIDKNSKDNDVLFDNIISFLINDVGYDEALINTMLATTTSSNKGDALVALVRQLNTNNIKTEIKKKHAILKNVLDNFIANNLDDISDNEFKSEIEKVLSSTNVQDSYDIVTELSNMAPSREFVNASEESKQLSEKYKNFFRDLKKYKTNLIRNRNLEKKTDQKYLQEVYLVTKYAMLGDIMSDMVKVANINQFKQSKAYDNKKFEKDFTFATGYTIDEIIDIYDRFRQWKKDNGEESTIGEYFDSNPNEKKSLEAVREAAFKTKQHLLSDADFSYMKDSIESPVSDEVINYKEDYHKIFDFAEILLSRPDVMESLRASQMFRDINTSIFNIENPQIQSMVDKITDDAAYDLLPEAKSITLKEEISKYFVHLYFSEIQNNGYTSNLRDEIIGAMEKYNILTLPMTSGSGMSSGMMHNIGNPIGVRNFISNFPEFFVNNVMQNEIQRLKDSETKFNKQDLENAYTFLERIELSTKNKMDYLEVQKSRQHSSSENEMLKDGFNKLSKETQTLLSLYHILKNQFDTSRSFFGEVLPTRFLKDYSNFLKEVVPNQKIEQDLENIKLMILSNTSLDILKSEKLIFKDGKEYSMPPASAYGIAKHYKKTVQTQNSKYDNKKIRTYALATTNGINGVALVQGSATYVPDSNVIPFNSILDIYRATNDINGEIIAETFSYTPRILSELGKPMAYTLNLTPHAYIKQIIHGHLENDIQTAIKNATQEGTLLTDEEIKQIVEDVLSKDLNNVYNKPGVPFLKNKDTAIDVSSRIRNQTFDVVLRSLQKKYGPQLDTVLQSLDGKLIKDEYYYSDISPSYTLFAALNILKSQNLPFTLENLQNVALNEIPSIEIFNETIGIQSNESEPLVNLIGNFGNYFTREDARSSGYVVKVNMKKPNGIGSKNVFYEIVKEAFQDTNMSKGELDTLMANILIADSIGMSVAEMKNSIRSLSRIPESQVAVIYETALKTKYNHVDRNIDNDTMLRHSRKYSEINKKVTDGKINELFGQIKSMSESLVRYQESPYEVGDILNFPDGVRGIVIGITSDNTVQYVINHKLTDGRNIFNSQRAIVSLENIIQKNNTRFALDGFVRTISGIMPDVEYRYVNDDEARKIQRSGHDSVSFYQDGIVYINVDKADRGVAIHEFAHPLTLAIRAENPELFTRIADLVSQSTAMDYVRRMYKDDLDTDEAMILEAIPTYIQFRYYARLSHEMSPEERATWEAFFAQANSIFKEALIGDVNTESSLDSVDFKTADLNSISDAILNDMLKGKEFVVKNKEAFNISRFLPYTMRASTASSVKNINLNNIDTLFQRKSHNTKQDKTRRQIRDSISGNQFNGLSGTYDLSMRNKEFFNNAGQYDQSKKDKFISTIVENEMAFYTGIENNVIRFLDELKTFEPLTAAKQTLFASWNKRHDLTNATDLQKEKLRQDVIKITNKLGYNYNLDKAMTLKDAEKALGIKIPIGVNLDETIVIIHNYGKPSQEISILNVSPEYLNNHGQEKNNIAAAFIGENMTNKEKRRAKRLKGVTLSNDNGHIEAFKTAVIAMAIKKASPGTVIRKVGAMHVKGDTISVRSRDVDDTIQQIELLMDNVPQLRENLEVDFKEIVSDKSLYNMNLYKVPLGTRLLNYFKTLASTLNENDRYKKSLDNTIDQGIKIFENGDFSYYKDMQKAVFGRIMFLYEELDTDVARASNEEYQFLLQMYRELTGYNEINTKRFNELSWDEKMIQTADRWTGQIKTWLFDQIDLASRKGVEEMLPFNKELDERTKTLNILSGNILSYGLDKSHALFKPLFKKMIGYDQNGNEVPVSTHEIHCDINDAETALALANNEITKEQLDFGKWIADSMYEEFVQYVMVVERKNISQKANMTETELRAAAENEVARRYKRGMMPVFVSSTGTALSEGRLMDALNMYMKNAGRFYGGALYEEFSQTEEADYQKESFKKITSPFWNQFQSAENFGGSFRMKMLGLDLKVRNQDTSIEVISPEIQNSLSYNLQNIGNYTII
jgi:hypothetical protein